MAAPPLPKLTRYVLACAKILLLGDWRITVAYAADDQLNDGQFAETEWMQNAHSATIRFSYDAFGRLGVDEQRETVIHELLHLRLRDTNYGVRRLAGQLGAQAEDVFRAQWDAAHEREVEQLARALAGCFGEPPWEGP